MKFIDVTLRDGGHQHGFNWPLEFVKRYLESLREYSALLLLCLRGLMRFFDESICSVP